ncbi:MAG: hypothetical protein JF607_03490 [Burkholderiales bacterium]|nr:hypothetical protein [Burkholderiales bacterium]
MERRRLVGKPLFGLGRILATPAALEVLTAAAHHPAKLLQRHQCGQWGELCSADKAANDQALISGGRLLSLYKVNDIRLYLITEAVSDAGQRECSTLLLPSEY